MQMTAQFKTGFRIFQLVSVVILLINLIQSSSGYIINDDGHLVPFKLYKKGNHGTRAMCFLHPRNCRGGFHKRMVEDPKEGLKTGEFNLLVQKRQLQQSASGRNGLPFRKAVESDAFDPMIGFKILRYQHPPKVNEPETRYLSKLYEIIPSLGTHFEPNDQKETKSNTVVKSLAKEAKQLLDNVNRGLDEVVDSGSLKKLANIKLDSLEYPDYSMWSDDFSDVYKTDTDHVNPKDDTNAFRPSERMEYYQFEPQYKVDWSDV